MKSREKSADQTCVGTLTFFGESSSLKKVGTHFGSQNLSGDSCAGETGRIGNL
ncbi:hypothetical protein JWG45_07830 [Leptospira sp. 201903070]|uniref:Uncharacterized protein n=1 Tax=Leptospira ainlahdjerensis TaxID=2810033 RepID=A0ABS2U9M6_9LEPT|nr:hypothetical protein [Leptospira ainlahdjerensis]MBM9577062.1 hypothetical protein [Leptospira ainlahdjerensis]